MIVLTLFTLQATELANKFKETFWSQRMNEIETLQAKAKAILENCEHWKSCQDGSYEMSLHYAGYDQVLKQIQELKAKSNV